MSNGELFSEQICEKGHGTYVRVTEFKGTIGVDIRGQYEEGKWGKGIRISPEAFEALM